MKPSSSSSYIINLPISLALLLASAVISATTRLGPWILALLLVVILYFLKVLLFNPWRIRRYLELQGIKGPKPSLLYGNLLEMQKIQSLVAKNDDKKCELVAHDYTSTLFPYFEQWRKEYGLVYTYSSDANKQHLYVNDPELVKEMSNQSVSSSLGKPSYITKRLAPMLGSGILRSNGHLWARQRKIVAPEFFMDKVKGMVGLMVESVEELTRKWEGYCIEFESQQENYNNHTNQVADIKVEEDLRSFSGDVISKACFGSSYLKGKRIFSKLRTLQKLLSNHSFLFGSHSFGWFAGGQRRRIEELEKEIESLIWEAVKERDAECWGGNKDLMQLILEGAIHSGDADDGAAATAAKDSECKKFVVDNCKNIYFAGHESIAVAASWCLMLLALHPQWQDRIREEVDEVRAAAGGGGLDADMLNKLKTVTMVIHEVLRLYPPAAFVSREALEETKIGHIVVPKGVFLWTLIPTLHRDPDIWGADVNEFNPQRFANGISNSCKLPQVYIPFGLGHRLCLGKTFALVQLKIVIFLIVSKFTFSLSPNYRHSPAFRMIVEPGQGVRLCIQRRDRVV